MSPWVSLYYWWTNDSVYSMYVTFFFFVGIFFHFFRKIEAGTEAELVFGESALGVFWKNGFCLVPTILPVLHNIDIHLLWNLKKSISVIQSSHDQGVDIHHYRDQRLPEYRINTNASLFELTTYRLFGNAFSWFFSLGSDPELKLQKLGFRIILVAIVTGWIANFFPKVPASQKPEKGVSVFDVDNWRLTSQTLPPLLEPKQGECVNIPSDGYARIGIWSLPTLMSGIEDEIIVMDNGTNYKWSWEQALKDNPVFSKEQIVLVRANGNGSICF